MKRTTILGIAALASCTSKPQATCPAIESITHGDAVRDAHAAMMKGDRHLLMLGGFEGVVPGVSHANGYPTRMVEGTSDTTTESCARQRPMAESYAAKYNQTIMRGR